MMTMQPISSSETGVRWRRIFAVLTLTFMLAEGGCQLMVWLWAGEQYRSFGFYRWSPYGLVRNNPDLTSPQFKINANGFRDLKDYDKKKRRGSIRIMMLGGSVLYSGLGGAVIPGIGRVDSGHTMSQYLQKEIEADPAFEDLEVEVINASVNFNRIVEVSTAYIAEYVQWDPDLVIVCGSANNFGSAPMAGSIYRREFNLQGPHPWHFEFQRLVNERGVARVLERVFRGLEEYSAAAGVGRKAMDRFVAMSGNGVRGVGARLQLEPPEKQAVEFADFVEYDEYIKAYLAYASALTAAAYEHGQEVAFFWEYFLAHLKGIKPFSAVEEELYRRNVRPTSSADLIYTERARVKVREFSERNKLRFLDPIKVLEEEKETVFIDYLHYTKEGNQIMARFMYRQLKDWLKSRAAEVGRAL